MVFTFVTFNNDKQVIRDAYGSWKHTHKSNHIPSMSNVLQRLKKQNI